MSASGIDSFFIKQIDNLISEFEEMRSRSKHDDCSDVMSKMKSVEMVTRGFALVERCSGLGSPYSRQIEDIRSMNTYDQDRVMRMIGVIQGLREDLRGGHLRSVEELIHGEVFAGFLEMADYLLSAGYKDAAAVIAGSSLEAHLREVAKRFGVATVVSTARGPEPKKADQLNAELVKASAYSVLDQKAITAWLDLRNKAPHGRYAEYEKEQVAILIAGVRNFMMRHPA